MAVSIPDKLWQPPFVVLETTMGVIVVELYWKHAPNTCRNFAELAKRCYYNNVKFHRIIRDFMIQGGDPTGTGRGGSSIYGKNFNDEIHDDLKHTGEYVIYNLLQGVFYVSVNKYDSAPPRCFYASSHVTGYAEESGKKVIINMADISGAGIISMANSGPNTNGSQFFITLGPAQWLDGKHAIFGRVYSGMHVVKQIGLVETDTHDKPVDDVKIVKAYVKEE